MDFNGLLLEISNQLSKDQLDNLKFLCQDKIGKRRMENIDSGIKLFVVLTERSELAADNTELLGRLLSKIRRDDLFQRLNSFGNGSTPRHQDDTENGTVSINSVNFSLSMIYTHSPQAFHNHACVHTPL